MPHVARRRAAQFQHKSRRVRGETVRDRIILGVDVDVIVDPDPRQAPLAVFMGLIRQRPERRAIAPCSKNSPRATGSTLTTISPEVVENRRSGLEPLDAGARHDLLEILEERYGRRSTIVTSQLPLSAWHEVIGDPILPTPSVAAVFGALLVGW